MSYKYCGLTIGIKTLNMKFKYERKRKKNLHFIEPDTIQQYIDVQ